MILYLYTSLQEGIAIFLIMQLVLVFLFFDPNTQLLYKIHQKLKIA